jgi:hypothetical protein
VRFQAGFGFPNFCSCNAISGLRILLVRRRPLLCASTSSRFREDLHYYLQRGMHAVRLKPRIALLQLSSSTSNLPRLTLLSASPRTCRWKSQHAESRHDEQSGTITPVPEESKKLKSQSPFYFEAGYAVFAKRRSRPFPPPFLSIPSGSFSDPLSTHNQSRDRRPYVDGKLIRGITNGDDAVLVSDNFICANDGVGAWAQKEKGHAAYVLQTTERDA